MSYSARPLSTDLLTKLVFLPGHGFKKGEVLSYRLVTGVPEYVRALADTPAHAQTPVMVSIVVDANNFYVTQDGYVDGIDYTLLVPPPAAFTAGVQYYLSEVNPGQMSTVAPSGLGQIISPLFVPDSTTSGYFQSNAGQLIESGQLFNWTVVSMNTIMAVNNGYMTSSGGTITLTLPPVAALGDLIRITNLTGNFTLTQNLGQTINFGKDTTTITTGSITSVHVGDTLEIVCYVANSGFQVLSSIGNLIYV